jgi:hypothetical protein
MITIKNLKNETPKEGWQVVICRGKSPLGNPFQMFNEGMRDEVCNKYEQWFKDNLNTRGVKAELSRLLALYAHYGKLDLYCWCHPKKCHGETIKAWLEQEYAVRFPAKETTPEDMEKVNESTNA